MSQSDYKRKKEKQKLIYNDMELHPDRNAAALYQQKPYYMMYTCNRKTVFEDITQSPESLADFIYHNQRIFNSVSEVVKFLNQQRR